MKPSNLFAYFDSTMYAAVSCGAIVAILLCAAFLSTDILPISTQVVVSRYVTITALWSGVIAVLCDRQNHSRSITSSIKALEQTYTMIAVIILDDLDDFETWRTAVKDGDIELQLEIEERVRERG